MKACGERPQIICVQRNTWRQWCTAGAVPMLVPGKGKGKDGKGKDPRTCRTHGKPGILPVTAPTCGKHGEYKKDCRPSRRKDGSQSTGTQLRRTLEEEEEKFTLWWYVILEDVGRPSGFTNQPGKSSAPAKNRGQRCRPALQHHDADE
eukprot:1503579-Amphidinium_carterae.5